MLHNLRDTLFISQVDQNEVVVSWKTFAQENGILSVFEESLNRLKLWDLGNEDFVNVGSGSSFSDNNEYLSIVRLASSDDKVFKKFRANRQYRKILEHVTKSLGYLYLESVGHKIGLKASFSKLNHCDRLGGPIRYWFKNIGLYSPTTIRYFYFHSEMERVFGDLSGLRVIEIGGGFGGQAAVSTTLNSGIGWTIFDLPEVLVLQQKYVSRANPNANIAFCSGLDIVETHGDLLSSNYALSEISRDLQLEYINKVILKCKKGYMEWNTISEVQRGGLSLLEILELIPGSTAHDEMPLSSVGNKIITWG